MDIPVMQAIIARLENEIRNLEVEKELQDVRVEDAAELTGNEHADASLTQQAWVAGNTIEMIDRQLSVRRKRLEHMRSQLPELQQMQMQVREVPRQQDEAEVPPETANAAQMPDHVKD